MHDRLENSEQEHKESDQSDKDMKMELEGKVDALQKQLTDLDTLRLPLNRWSDSKCQSVFKHCKAYVWTVEDIVTIPVWRGCISSQAGFGERFACWEGAEAEPAKISAAGAGQQRRAAHAAAATPGPARGQWGSTHGVWTQSSVRRVHCGLMEQELRSLKREKQQLQQKCEQQEQTLQEMGLHLSQSVLLPLLGTSSHPVLIFMALSFLLKVQTKDGGL